MSDRSQERSRKGRPRIAERGGVLPWVLWVSMYLAIVAGLVAQMANTDARRVRALERGLQAEAAAAGAYEVALDRLRRDDPELTAAMLDRRTVDISFPGGAASILVSREDERIDLNTANVAILAALFQQAGVDLSRASELAAAVADFRDPDQFVSVNGAEAPDYRRAGLPHGPKNAAFERSDELALVLGVDYALYERVAPFVTAHLGTGAQFARSAARPSGSAVAARDAEPGPLASLSGTAAPQPVLMRPAQNRTTYRIDIEARAESGALGRATAVVRPASGGDPGKFDLLYWTRERF